MHRPRMTRSADSLLGQVLAANVVLVVLTLLAASLAAGLDLSVQGQRWEFLVLAMAMVLTLLREHGRCSSAASGRWSA